MTPVEAEAQLRTGRRQSLWAPVFFLITALRRVGYAQLIFLFVILSNRGSVVLFGIAPAVAAIAVAAAVLAWWRFTFTLTDDSRVVESGVLNRQRTVVPLAKVQSVAKLTASSGSTTAFQSRNMKARKAAVPSPTPRY